MDRLNLWRQKAHVTMGISKIKSNFLSTMESFCEIENIGFRYCDDVSKSIGLHLVRY